MDEASETEGDRRRRVGGGDGSGSACYLSLAIVLYDAKVEDLGRLTARRLRLMTGMMLYSRLCVNYSIIRIKKSLFVIRIE